MGFVNSSLICRCLPNGTWFTHPESGQEWSNYTNCVDVDDLEVICCAIYSKAKHKHYSWMLCVCVCVRSFASLWMSSTSKDMFSHCSRWSYRWQYSWVFGTYERIILLHLYVMYPLNIRLPFPNLGPLRSLRCTRIRIHIQLFTSLALTCITWLLWYKLIIERPDIIRDNSVDYLRLLRWPFKCYISLFVSVYVIDVMCACFFYLCYLKSFPLRTQLDPIPPSLSFLVVPKSKLHAKPCCVNLLMHKPMHTNAHSLMKY